MLCTFSLQNVLFGIAFLGASWRSWLGSCFAGLRSWNERRQRSCAEVATKWASGRTGARFGGGTGGCCSRCPCDWRRCKKRMKFHRPSCLALCLCHLCFVVFKWRFRTIQLCFNFLVNSWAYSRSPDMFVIFPLHWVFTGFNFCVSPLAGFEKFLCHMFV